MGYKKGESVLYRVPNMKGAFVRGVVEEVFQETHHKRYLIDGHHIFEFNVIAPDTEEGVREDCHGRAYTVFHLQLLVQGETGECLPVFPGYPPGN